MRAKDRAEVADLVRRQLAPMNDYMAKIMAVLAGLGNDVAEIRPASVDLTQAMADDIVRKIHGPLTISKEFSAWIAEQGKFHELFYQFPIGYGSDAGRGNLRLKGDGSMTLQIEDHNGASLWHGTFVPPDFGKTDA